MSQYGICIGAMSEPEVARFSEEQTATHKDWITAIKGLITAPDAGMLYRDVWLPEITIRHRVPSKGIDADGTFRVLGTATVLEDRRTRRSQPPSGA